MCRLVGYLGRSTSLDRLLLKPEHSLLVQSYQPKQMTAGLMNADGFGMGWYHPQRDANPFTYRNVLPIWSDENLPSLSRYIESGCMLANVRSATPGLPTDLSNCQPFQHGSILGMHNGYVESFSKTLYRPLRDRLCDTAYQLIKGNTDSEHLFALVIHELETTPDLSLTEALRRSLTILAELAEAHNVKVSANVILSNGRELVASRFASGTLTPSLHWLRDDPLFPDAVLIASEPLFEGDWSTCPDRSLITVTHDLDLQAQPL